jgi:hypothetical protein
MMMYDVLIVLQDRVTNEARKALIQVEEPLDLLIAAETEVNRTIVFNSNDNNDSSQASSEAGEVCVGDVTTETLPEALQVRE